MSSPLFMILEAMNSAPTYVTGKRSSLDLTSRFTQSLEARQSLVIWITYFTNTCH